MSNMMKFYLDTNSLVYAWNAGGAALLDKYAAYALEAGFELAITDVVDREILAGPKSIELTQWLQNNSVVVETTAEFQKYDKYFKDLDSGHPTGDYNPANAGDRSMSEMAAKAKAAGVNAKVFSDDSWFSNKQELRKFGLNTDVGLTNFQILNNMAISGQISPEEFERFKAGFINQPPVGNSARLNRFLTAAELSEVLKGGSLSNAILPKLGTGLKVVGVAGLIYDIGTSSAQAAEAANSGNKDEAGNIMARLAARLYFGFEAGAGGAMLGAAAGAPGGLTAAAGAIIGGIAGGIVGVIVGDVVADTIWKWADDAIASLMNSDIEEQPASTPQIVTPEILTAAGTVYQNLVASGLSDARAQSIIASLAAEFARRDALGHPIAADELVKEIIGSVQNNQAVPETDEDGLIVTSLDGTTSSATTFVDSDGSFKESIVRADGTSEESRYNKKGQLVEKVDTNPSGTIVRTYNTYGQKTREISYATNGNRIYENEYIGDVFTKKHYNSITGFIEKKVEHIGENIGEVYLYNVDDNNGRIISASIYEDDELIGEMNASYDASGKLIREEYSYSGELWREIFYSYDLNTGKLASTQEYEEGQLANESFYDGETGHVVRMKNYSQGVLTSESNYDRLTGEYLPTPPSSDTEIPSGFPKMGLVYNDAGQRIGYTVEYITASGIKWIQAYDFSNRKVSEKRTLVDGTTIETKIHSTGSTKITENNGTTFLELPYEEKLSEIVTFPDGTITKTTFRMEQRVSETAQAADGRTINRLYKFDEISSETTTFPDGTVVEGVFSWGEKRFETITHPDGTKSERLPDGTPIVINRNADGAITSQTRETIQEDGTKIATTYEASNFLFFGKLGAKIQEVAIGTDGTVSTTKYSEILEGRKLSEVIFAPNGIKIENVYWNGNLISEILTSANGNVLTTKYNFVGGVDSESIASPDGTLTRSVFSFGTKRYSIVWKPDGSMEERAVDGTSIAFVRSPDGEILAQNVTTEEPDGSRVETTREARDFMLTGRIGEKLREIKTSADGTITTIEYRFDIAVTETRRSPNGDTRIRTFDTMGHNPVEDSLQVDGTHTRITYSSGRKNSETVTSADGTVVFAIYNSAGVKLSSRTTNIDGSYVEYRYNEVDGSLMTKTTSISADEKLTEFYLNGNKLYEKRIIKKQGTTDPQNGEFDPTEIVRYADGTKIETEFYMQLGSDSGIVGSAKRTRITTADGKEITETNFSRVGEGRGGLIESIKVTKLRLKSDGQILEFDNSKETFWSDGEIVRERSIYSDWLSNRDSYTKETEFSGGKKTQAVTIYGNGETEVTIYDSSGLVEVWVKYDSDGRWVSTKRPSDFTPSAPEDRYKLILADGTKVDIWDPDLGAKVARAFANKTGYDPMLKMPTLNKEFVKRLNAEEIRSIVSRLPKEQMIEFLNMLSPKQSLAAFPFGGGSSGPIGGGGIAANPNIPIGGRHYDISIVNGGVSSPKDGFISTSQLFSNIETVTNNPNVKPWATVQTSAQPEQSIMVQMPNAKVAQVASSVVFVGLADDKKVAIYRDANGNLFIQRPSLDGNGNTADGLERFATGEIVPLPKGFEFPKAGEAVKLNGVIKQGNDIIRLYENSQGSIFGVKDSSGVLITITHGTAPVPPVVLDLDGDGALSIRPVDLAGSSPTFNWDGHGENNVTAWIGSDDGFLAIDLAADGDAGSDGIIDQAKELAFAHWIDESTRPEGSLPVTDLEGLRLVFDTNHDNILDHRDARWNEFRVWQDANQNGVSDIGELKTMSEAGIKLINLMPTADGARAFADGSAITGTSSMEMTDGSQRLVGDVTLAYHPSSLGRSV